MKSLEPPSPRSNTSSRVIRWNTRNDERPVILEPATDGRESSPSIDGDLVFLEGVLLNRLELANNLGVGPGSSQATLIAHAFRKYRDEVVHHLKGAFLLVIWDSRTRTMLTIRDCMGLHPGYYHWDGTTITVAASVAALHRHGVPKRVHRVLAAEYVADRYHSLQRSESFFESIRRLPPAHCLLLTRSSFDEVPYWEPLPAEFDWATDREIGSFPGLFEKGVARCLDCGATGIALSGGFDSVAIAVAAERVRTHPRPLHALSLRFDNSKCDEGATQTSVANALGMPQTVQSVSDSLDTSDMVWESLAFSPNSPSPVLSI